MTVTGSLLLALAFQTTPAQTPAPDPTRIRIFVQTDIGGAGSELAAKRQSAADLTSSLTSKNKKKTLAVVDAARDADAVIEVIERRVVTPKFVMGLPPRSGDPMPVTGPTRQPILRVRVTSGETTLEFTNTNKPIESPAGWKMAADDVVGQIEKWAVAHRDEIVKRRGPT